MLLAENYAMAINGERGSVAKDIHKEFKKNGHIRMEHVTRSGIPLFISFKDDSMLLAKPHDDGKPGHLDMMIVQPEDKVNFLSALLESLKEEINEDMQR